MTHLLPYLELMRPRQWVKNLLILAPAFFAGVLWEPSVLLASVVTVTAFSFTASAVYILNDLIDCSADRSHPKKCLRPLPAGRAKKQKAFVLLGALLIVGAVTASYIPFLPLLLALYVFLNLLYTFYLKHVAVIDIVLVATFYLLRIIAGGVAAAVALSPWIVLATFFLALFLVSGKRLGEYGREGQRRSLDGYRRQTLEGLVLASAALAIASYSLWCVLAYPSPYAVYTIIPVCAVIFRTLNRLYENPEQAEAPEALVFADWWTFGLTILWGASMLALFYAT